MHNNNTMTLRYAILGALFGCAFPIFSTLGDVAVQGLPLTFESLWQVQKGSPLHWVIDTAPFFLGLFASFAGRRQDRLIDLNEALNQRVRERDEAIDQLRSLQWVLEQRVSDRTTDLASANQRLGQINRQLEQALKQSQRRAVLLQASTQVSRAVAQLRDLNRLLSQVTHLISQYFGFYHVGVFLVDDASIGQRYAVLRAANSKGGQRMLGRHHRLAVGLEGIVGYVTGTGQPRVTLDVGADSTFFDNPDLPDTRSELALPLRVGDEIIGALDVQSTKEAAFDQEDLALLTVLADQIAIAIENARLFQRSEAALEEAEETHRRYLRHEWDSFLSARRGKESSSSSKRLSLTKGTDIA